MANQNSCEDLPEQQLKDFDDLNFKSCDKSDEMLQQHGESACNESEKGKSKPSADSTDEQRSTNTGEEIDAGPAREFCAKFPDDLKNNLTVGTSPGENDSKLEDFSDFQNTAILEKTADFTIAVINETENKETESTGVTLRRVSSEARMDNSDEFRHGMRMSVLNGSDADLLDLVGGKHSAVATVNQHQNGNDAHASVFVSSEEMIHDWNASLTRGSEDDNTEYCPTHSNTAISYFCKSCDKIGCKTCMSTEHGNCTNVNNIRDIVTGLADRTECRTLIETLSRTAYELEKKRDRYHSNCRRKDFLHEKALTMIKNERKKVNRIFDNLERAALNSVETHDKAIEKRLESVMSRNETMYDTLVKIKTELEQKEKTGQDYLLFVTMREAERKVVTFQDELTNLDKDNNLPYYEFVPSKEVSPALESLKSFGRLVFQNMTTTFVADLDVQSSKENHPCEIKDICMLPGKRMILADKTNTTLKVVAINKNKILSVVVMSTEPWGVTKTDDNNIVVTLPREKKIQFLSVTRSSYLTKSDEVKVHHQYSGIVHSRGSLIVSCLLENAVHVLNLNGTLLKVYCTDFAGHKNFTLSSFHALSPVLSPNEDTIYVLDNLTSLTSMSLDGELKATYNDADLVKPRGLAVAENGNIYVCGLQSNNVHVLTKDLVRIQVLLNSDHGIAGPESLSFHDNKLYVGMKDKIKVFQIT